MIKRFLISGRSGAAAKWGVEGFSEVLAKELGPLGIKVTIVEPAASAPTSPASSTTLLEGPPEYDATVGAAIRFQRDYNGKQPGDPAKAAAAIIRIAGHEQRPLRLLLGSDAFTFAIQNDIARRDSDEKWRELYISSDFSRDLTA